MTDFTVYDWSLVESETQFTDEHGEYWFNDLDPGIYTVRENLDIQMTRLTVGDLPSGVHPFFDGNSFVVNGVTYEFEIDDDPDYAPGITGDVEIVIAFEDSNSEAAAAIGEAIDIEELFLKVDVVNNVITLSNVVFNFGTNEYESFEITFDLTNSQPPDAFPGFEGETFDYSGFSQSTMQAQGNPGTNLPSLPAGFPLSQVIVGDDPSQPGKQFDGDPKPPGVPVGSRCHPRRWL